MSAVVAFTTEYIANMTEYISSGVNDNNRTEEEVAQKFTDEYLSAVSKGFNIVINNKLHPSMLSPTGPKAMAYKQTILSALLQAKTDTSEDGAMAKMALSSGFVSAAIGFWTGAMLEGVYKGMPPGHIGITPVNVVFPGVVAPIAIPSATPLTMPFMLPTAIALSYAAHMATIMFLVPAMILPPPATPYPLPLVGFI